MKLIISLLLASTLYAQVCVTRNFGLTYTAPSGPAAGNVYPAVLIAPQNVYVMWYGDSWCLSGCSNWIDGFSGSLPNNHFPYNYGSLARYMDDLSGSSLLDSVRSFPDSNGHSVTNSISFISQIFVNSTSGCAGCWVGTTLTADPDHFPNTLGSGTSPQWIVQQAFAAGRAGGGFDFDPNGIYFFATGTDVPRWGSFFDVVNYNSVIWKATDLTKMVPLLEVSVIDGLNFTPLLNQIVSAITTIGDTKFSSWQGWQEGNSVGQCVNADPDGLGTRIGNMCNRDSQTVILGGNSYPTSSILVNNLIHGKSNVTCHVTIQPNQ